MNKRKLYFKLFLTLLTVSVAISLTLSIYNVVNINYIKNNFNIVEGE